MYKHLASPETLRVKPGDVVEVQGNRGTVTERIETAEAVFVRVEFDGYLKEYGQYNGQVYGGFKVIEEAHTWEHGKNI